MNPKGGEVEGLPAYKSLAEIPPDVKLDRISVYLPPAIGLKTAAGNRRPRLRRAVAQSRQRKRRAGRRRREAGLNVIQACSIVAVGMSPHDLPYVGQASGLPTVTSRGLLHAMSFTIEINDDDQPHAVDRARLKKAVRGSSSRTPASNPPRSASPSSTDARMHALNRQYLQHDYPTDVLSFVLDHDEAARSLDGEIIASSDYAAREAPHYGWTTDDELLLYVIHGCLHLVGHDDTTPDAAKAMREAEARQLEALGLTPRR